MASGGAVGRRSGHGPLVEVADAPELSHATPVPEGRWGVTPGSPRAYSRHRGRPDSDPSFGSQTAPVGLEPRLEPLHLDGHRVRDRPPRAWSAG